MLHASYAEPHVQPMLPCDTTAATRASASLRQNCCERARHPGHFGTSFDTSPGPSTSRVLSIPAGLGQACWCVREVPTAPDRFRAESRFVGFGWGFGWGGWRWWRGCATYDPKSNFKGWGVGHCVIGKGIKRRGNKDAGLGGAEAN